MDIDKIFAASKKKAKSAPAPAPQPKAAPLKPKIKKTKPAKKEAKAPPAGRFTEDGFRIVGEGDLKTGGRGDTKDCPFDCDCCF